MYRGCDTTLDGACSGLGLMEYFNISGTETLVSVTQDLVHYLFVACLWVIRQYALKAPIT